MWKGIFCCLAVVGVASATAGEQRLSRSIYVPVIFSVTADVAKDLRIWIADEKNPRYAVSHTFLFTLYPDQEKKFLPEYVEVRVKADGVCAGAGIDTNFLVSPTGIHTSAKTLRFDAEELAKQARAGRRDLRVSPKLVRIRCGPAGASGFEVGERSDVPESTER